jgi:microcystin-dependent protein
MALPPPLAQGLYPIGTILAFSSPLNQEQLKAQGWLYCNGNTYSRTGFADLYGVIGDNFGAGDTQSTFNVPDLRGFVLRGANNGKTPPTDPDASSRTALQPGGNTGDRVGSTQGFATRLPASTLGTNQAGDHTHTVTNLPTDSSSSAVAGSYQSIWNSGSADTASAGAHSHTVSGGGDLETVPINVYAYYIIKYADIEA